MKSKTVFVTGVFNVLHPGHLRLLRYAKSLSEKLIVGIESDLFAGTSACVNENLRLESIQSIGYVDEAFIMRQPLKQVILKLKPETIIKGKEYELAQNPEIEYIKEYGGKLLFSSGDPIFSSIDLLQKEFSGIRLSTVQHHSEFLNRHHIDLNNLKRFVEKFQSLNVCVIGDLIIDEYITCDPIGLSQEDPTIVVTPIESHRFLGGSSIVAAHASKLGATVDYISVSGDDELNTFTINQLNTHGVASTILTDQSRPTTLKKRYRCKGKTLLRVSHVHQESISTNLQDIIFDHFLKKIHDYNLIVFSDFNYGCLPQPLVDRIIEFAKKFGIPMIADSQSSSQFGNIARFKNMNLICPTEREARISTRSFEDGLVIMTETLRQSSLSQHILLKLGEEGVLIHSILEDSKKFSTDQINALATVVRDVSGAGDSMLIASGMSLALGSNIWEAAYLGSLVAAIHVSRVGNTPVSKSELLEALIN